jgi:hypothetical protein
VSLNRYTSTPSADTSVVTTAETVLATVSGVNSYAPGARITIRGGVQFTPGTATTGLTFRIRRGTDATGTLIQEANLEIVAGVVGSTEDHELEVTDQVAGELAQASYVLTVVQTAATGNGTAVQAWLEVEVG